MALGNSIKFTEIFSPSLCAAKGGPTSEAKSGRVNGARQAATQPFHSSANSLHLPMVLPPSPNTANGGGVVLAYLNHKSLTKMEKLLTIHLINFAVHTIEHLHALIITMGHLVK